MIAENRQLFPKRDPEITRRRENKSRNFNDLDQDLPQNQKRGEEKHRL